MSTTSYTLHPPFTTPFTAPSSCTDSLANNGVRTDSVGTWRTVLQAVYPQDSACFGPGWTAAANSYAQGANFWAGNPLCPSGQTVAQTYSSADVTTAICCSDGWGNIFANGNAFSGSNYGFWMCDRSWTTPKTTVVSGSVLSGGIVTPGIATITGPGLVESTAEYIFIYSMITSTSSATESSLTSSAASSSSTATPLPEPSQPGLSGGAIAGICIGCIAFLVLLVAGLWFRRRRRPTENRERVTPSVPGYEKAELPGQSRVIAELSGQGKPRELSGNGSEMAQSHSRATDTNVIYELNAEQIR
ncbi:hypothetical protein KJ359_007486 [Pestalotiopsis sp. 9143b]|nr:hypothetical protein KJ359_007486 [Pestalotiopsis sp. 9143b]